MDTGSEHCSTAAHHSIGTLPPGHRLYCRCYHGCVRMPTWHVHQAWVLCGSRYRVWIWPASRSIDRTFRRPRPTAQCSASLTSSPRSISCTHSHAFPQKHGEHMCCQSCVWQWSTMPRCVCASARTLCLCACVTWEGCRCVLPSRQRIRWVYSNHRATRRLCVRCVHGTFRHRSGSLWITASTRSCRCVHTDKVKESTVGERGGEREREAARKREAVREREAMRGRERR